MENKKRKWGLFLNEDDNIKLKATIQNLQEKALKATQKQNKEHTARLTTKKDNKVYDWNAWQTVSALSAIFNW